MEASTVARIEKWDRRAVDDGRVGLSELGDAEFSGAVDAGGAWFFVLNGRIVGEHGGSVDRVGAGDGLTAYTAPHPSLPLLFAMQERGGERQGRYFTDDTGLGDVHETLSAGSFTGYVELSERIHSGDYYLVYYGGRALFVAFVGTSGQLVAGEEAFERARDEVGIYEIYSVDLEVRDPPEPSAGGRAGAAGNMADGPVAGLPDPDPGTERDRIGGRPAGDGDETDASTSEDPVEGLRDPDPDAARSRMEESSEEGSPEKGTPETGGATTSRERSDPDTPEPDTPEERTDTGEPDVEADPGEGGTDTGEPDVEADPGEGGTGAGGNEEPPREDGEQNRPGSETGWTSEAGRDELPWNDGQTVPALDPERAAVPARDSPTETESSPEPGSQPGRRSSDPPSKTGVSGGGTGGNGGAGGVREDRVAELESELETLRDQVESLGRERDRLAERQNRTAEGGTDVDQAAELSTEQTAATKALTPKEAFAGTDVFVRYASANRPTLADAHRGAASFEAVKQNRRLKTHTRFDAGGATVDGEPFESFLRNTLAYRSVAWLTTTFLFELRQIGTERLRDLYDALPDIDRAEFDGTVGGSDQEPTFDIVFRNKTGEPLFLADIEEGEGPTDGRPVSELLDRSRGVAGSRSSIAGVFLITSGSFDTEAHKAVRNATKSGFFSRDSRASFVKNPRNDGYHVCLVEAGTEGFYLRQPEF
jgi:hypothetical protein